MTQTLPEDTDCALCGRSPGDQSPYDRFAAPGPMLVVLHHNGVRCGLRIHQACVQYIRQYGPLQDNCPCGAGPVDDGYSVDDAAEEEDRWPEDDDDDSDSGGSDAEADGDEELGPMTDADDVEPEEQRTYEDGYRRRDADDSDDEESSDQSSDEHGDAHESADKPSGADDLRQGGNNRPDRDHRRWCSECNGPVDSPPRGMYSNSVGQVLLVLHSASGSGHPCGCRIHSQCLRELARYGTRDCMCGAGPILGGQAADGERDLLPESDSDSDSESDSDSDSESDEMRDSRNWDTDEADTPPEDESESDEEGDG